MDPAPRIDWPRTLFRAVLVNALGFLWVTMFWFRPASRWPVWKDIYRGGDRLVRDVTGLEGIFVWAFKSYVFVLVPVFVLLLVFKRPTALGMGKMARFGWRIVAVGFLIALPVLVWLGLRPGMQEFYAHMFKPGAWRPLLANALVIAVEHAWIEGVILALALPRGGFLQDEGDPEREGPMAFLGFGHPTGRPGRGARSSPGSASPSTCCPPWCSRRWSSARCMPARTSASSSRHSRAASAWGC